MLAFLRLSTRPRRSSDSDCSLLPPLQVESESDQLAVNLVLVGMVTFHNGRILLVRRSKKETFLPGVWSLPAGKAVPGEPLEDAALRELKEEAGVYGSVREILGAVWFDSNYHGKRVHNLQVNFAVDAASEDVDLDPSNDKYLWLPVSRMSNPPIPLDDFTRVVMNSAIEGAGHE